MGSQTLFFCAHLLRTARQVPERARNLPEVKEENAGALASLYAELDGTDLPLGE